MKLTPAEISSLCEGQGLSEITMVKASKRGISDVDDISVVTNLRILDLSYNELKSTSLKNLKWSKCLKHLDISNNEIININNLSDLENLEVLILGKNSIKDIGVCINFKKLKALIANDNQITSTVGIISGLRNLNSLVLSRNKIREFNLPNEMKFLTKLTLSHNELHDFPKVFFCPVLKELRLNGNKITFLPDLETSVPTLELLDLGNNLIKSEDALDKIASLRKLRNLSIKGCPIMDETSLKGKISETVSKFKFLEFFNGNIVSCKTKKRSKRMRRT